MKNALSPVRVIGFFAGLLLLLTLVSVAAALGGYGVSVSENQILYLFSTSAQVIAAIYGLTLTGFIFFRNELSREVLEDETLADAVGSLKKRYFVLLVFITVLVTIALLLANLAISYEGDGSDRLSMVIMNGGQSAFITSLFAVSYFIFDVISPRRLESASRALQSKVDPTLAQARGSLTEFLKNYNQIESLLENAGLPFEEKTPAAAARPYARHMPNSRLAEMLLRNEKIDQSLFQRLRSLIMLRNSIIHGAYPAVSQKMVKESAEVLQELQAAMKRDNGNGP